MPRLTDAQLAQLCATAGFRGSALTAAVAVALAESGGDTQAVHTNLDSHRSRDRGVFQINDYWHKEVTDAQAFDPTQNAAAAYRISKRGTDWHEWSTWPAGALAYAPEAKVAVARAGQAGGTQTVDDEKKHQQAGGTQTVDDEKKHQQDGGLVPGVPDPGDLFPGVPNAVPNPLDAINSLEDGVKAIAGAVVKVGAWVADPHNWLRIAMVTTGSAGVLIALAMIAKSGAAGETVSGSVQKATTAAKSAATAAVAAA